MWALAGQFSWLISGRIIAAGIQAVTLIFVARALGPADFGLFNAVLGIMIVMQAISDLGVGKLLVRERSSGERPELVAGGIRLNARSSAVLGIVLGIGLATLGFASDQRFLLMLPLAVSVAGEKNADTWLGIAIADGDVRYSTMILVARRACALAIFLLLSSTPFPAIVNYSSAMACAAVGSVVFARRLISPRVKTMPAMAKVTIRAAVPYWVNTFAVQLRNLDTAIVTAVAGAGAAGFYSTASRLTTPLRMLPNSFAVVMLPHATRTQTQSIRTVLVRVGIFVSITGAMYLLLAVLIPWVIPLLGEAYRPATVPLQIVLVGLVFAGLTSLLGAVMQGRGMQKSVAMVSVGSTVYTLVALWALAHFLGAIGAALGLATGFALEAIALLISVIYVESRESRE